ncbi:hypothetical protein RRG08_027971 [Elysia crispata]|uniref:Uncharacterized protein n=1 Tax=Elysia crispata TaxID=231223 RepID=A0AAE1DIB3_9GAST|nr:hypothetical protein RRG08_027971 [Elysia crispata]
MPGQYGLPQWVCIVMCGYIEIITSDSDHVTLRSGQPARCVCDSTGGCNDQPDASVILLEDATISQMRL